MLNFDRIREILFSKSPSFYFLLATEFLLISAIIFLLKDMKVSRYPNHHIGSSRFSNSNRKSGTYSTYSSRNSGRSKSSRQR